MKDVKKYLTVREIAEKLDFTEEWVRDLITRKELKATKIGRWRISPEDLEEFIKSRTNKE
jgi:excisionase family DNA binding protein